MALNESRTLQIVAKMTDQFTRPLSKMERSMTAFGIAARRSLGAAAIGFGAIAAASVVGFRAMLRVADGLDKIAKASDNLGITAESLTAIRTGAELADVSIEQLGTAMKTFSKLVDEAREGGDKQTETLARLSLKANEFQDGQLDVVDVLARVADGMQDVESATARTRLLVDLFGKSGTQMGALLKGGGEEVRKLAIEAEKLGLVFSREELQQVEDMNDAWKALTQTFRGLAERMVTDIAPAFTAFFKTLRETVGDNSIEIGQAMVRFVGLVLDGLMLLREALTVLQKMVGGFKIIGSLMREMGSVLKLEVLKFGGITKSEEGEVELLQTRLAAAHFETVQLANDMLALQQTTDLSTEAFAKLQEQLRKLVSGEIRGRTDAVPTPGKDDKKDEQPDPTFWERYWSGFNKGATKAIEKWQDFGAAGEHAAQQIIDGGLDSLSDSIASIIDGSKSAKEAFKDFAKALLADLAKIIARLIVMEALYAVLGLLGAEKGAVIPETENKAKGGVRRMARGGLNRSGGVATRPTVLFGEGKNAEAFVPLPDNRSIPVTLTGGSGQTVNYTFNITAMDGKDVQRVLIEQQSTLRSIWQNQVETRIGMRQVIQRAG